MLGPEALAGHAGFEIAVVEFSAAEGADAVEDFFFAVGEMAGEPIVKEAGQCEREAENGVRGESAPASAAAWARAGISWSLRAGMMGANITPTGMLAGGAGGWRPIVVRGRSCVVP